MFRFLIGLAFGFMIGMPYGIFETVEVPDNFIVKATGFIKGLMEVIGK